MAFVAVGPGDVHTGTGFNVNLYGRGFLALIDGYGHGGGVFSSQFAVNSLQPERSILKSEIEEGLTLQESLGESVTPLRGEGEKGTEKRDWVTRTVDRADMGRRSPAPLRGRKAHSWRCVRRKSGGKPPHSKEARPFDTKGKLENAKC